MGFAKARSGRIAPFRGYLKERVASGRRALGRGVAILVAFHLAAPALADENVGALQFMAQVVEEIREGPVPPGCSDLGVAAEPTRQRQGQGRSTSANCPTEIIDQVENSRLSSIFGIVHAPIENCRLAGRAREAFANGDELERFFVADPKVNVGLRAPFIDKQACLPRWLGADKRKEVVAEYYYIANRLRSALAGSIQAISNTDFLMGVKPFNGIHCSAALMPDTSGWCRTAVKCGGDPGRANYESMVEKAQSALLMREGLIDQSNEYSTWIQGAGQWVSQTERDRRARENNSRLEQIRFLENTNPVIKGNVFKLASTRAARENGRYSLGEHIARELTRAGYNDRDNIRQAVQAQLGENRRKLAERHEKIKEALQCINSTEREGCGSLNEILAESPDYLGYSIKGRGQNAGPAEMYLAQAACIHDTRKARDMANEGWNDFVINSVLTVGTAGLGPLAAGVSKAVGAGARTISLVTRLADAGVLAMDGFNAGREIAGTVQECQRLLNKFDTDFKAQASGGEAPSCPKGQVGAPNALADYEACMMTAFTRVTPALLPFLPRVAKKWAEAHGGKPPHVDGPGGGGGPHGGGAEVPHGPVRVGGVEVAADRLAQNEFQSLFRAEREAVESGFQTAERVRGNGQMAPEARLQRSLDAETRGSRAANEADALARRYDELAAREPNPSKQKWYRDQAAGARKQSGLIRDQVRLEVERRQRWLAALVENRQADVARDEPKVAQARNNIRDRAGKGMPTDPKELSALAESARKDGTVLAQQEAQLKKLIDAKKLKGEATAELEKQLSDVRSARTQARSQAELAELDLHRINRQRPAEKAVGDSEQRLKALREAFDPNAAPAARSANLLEQEKEMRKLAAERQKLADALKESASRERQTGAPKHADETLARARQLESDAQGALREADRARLTGQVIGVRPHMTENAFFQRSLQRLPADQISIASKGGGRLSSQGDPVKLVLPEGVKHPMTPAGIETIPGNGTVRHIEAVFDDATGAAAKFPNGAYLTAERGIAMPPFSISRGGSQFKVSKLKVTVEKDGALVELLIDAKTPLSDLGLRYKIRHDSLKGTGFSGGHTLATWEEVMRTYPDQVKPLPNPPPVNFTLPGSSKPISLQQINYEFHSGNPASPTVTKVDPKTVFQTEEQLVEFEQHITRQLAGRDLRAPLGQAREITLDVPIRRNGVDTTIPVVLKFNGTGPVSTNQLGTWYVKLQ